MQKVQLACRCNWFFSWYIRWVPSISRREHTRYHYPSPVSINLRCRAKPPFPVSNLGHPMTKLVVQTLCKYVQNKCERECPLTFQDIMPGLRLSSGSSDDTSRSSIDPPLALNIWKNRSSTVVNTTFWTIILQLGYIVKRSTWGTTSLQWSEIWQPLCTSPTTASSSTGFREHVE